MTQPTYPRANSLQAMTLLAFIENAGAGITHRTVDRMTHSYRLASYIDSLKKKGWLIRSKQEQVSVFYGSRNAPIKRYWLEDGQSALLMNGLGADYIGGVRDILKSAQTGANRPKHTANHPHNDDTTKGGE